MLHNQQKKIEINIIQQQEQQQQQQQQQQNEQQKEEILEAGKRCESYEKRVAHPFEQIPEKNNEMPPPPAVTTTAPSKTKSFMPTAKSVMDARVAKKELKKARLQKKLSENTEKMNVIKKQKLS